MSLKSAITRTINYARNFGTKLNSSSVADRLISSRYYSLQPISRSNLAYHQKLQTAQKFVHHINNQFSDILLFAITGSVASGYPKVSDDIDFLIITRPHTLWFTRLRLFFFLRRFHQSFRRAGQTESPNQFCFNLWLDESALSLPKSKQNLRNAVDLVLLKPLINRHHTYHRFLLANPWAKQYVCTPYTNLIHKKISPVKVLGSSKGRRTKDGFCFENYKLKIGNSIAFLMQLAYMLPKLTTESVSLHFAFFHPKKV